MTKARILFVVLISFLLASCVTYQPGKVSNYLNEESAGRIYFESSSPYDFNQAKDKNAPLQIVHGDLVMPETSTDKVPAMIFLHGSGGVFQREYTYANLLKKRGYAVFILDSFAPRGVSSTVSAQTDVTSQMMIADAYAALRLLATHPKIDATRVGAVGWSKGAIGTVLTSVDRVSKFYALGSEKFAYTVSYYPFCGYELGINDKLSSPALMLLGELDDWTPSKPCVKFADALKEKNKPIEYIVYPGAHHAFDSENPAIHFSGDRITIRDTSDNCTLVLGDDGKTRSKGTGKDISTFWNRVALLRSCAVKGASLGGNPKAKEDAWNKFINFADKYSKKK